MGGDFDIGVDVHLRGRGLDAAAVATVRSTGVQGASGADLAFLHAATEHDPPVFTLLEGARPDGAFVVDQVAVDGVFRLGGHDHLPAVGPDQFAVLDQGIQHATFDGHGGQAVPVEVEGDLVPGGQRHVAAVVADLALVAHLVGNQRHHAAGRLDLAPVLDPAVTAPAVFEVQPPVEKILIADLQGGGDQAAHVHLRTLAEGNTRRVGQKDLAVGLEPTQDLAGIFVENAVERGAVTAGLIEAHPGILADVETLPLGDDPLTALLDDQLVAVTGEGGIAMGQALPVG